MKTIILATKNKGKIREFKEALKTLGLEGVPVDEIQHVEEPEENGRTFGENALLKAKYYMENTGYPCLADDSGLAVDFLNGEPGIYSARYAGNHGCDEANNEKLRKKLLGQPLENRKAHYICALALVYPDGKTITAIEKCSGYIQEEYMGNGGFGYDPLFYLPEYGKTMAEISLEEKNRISHRGKALALLLERLSL